MRTAARTGGGPAATTDPRARRSPSAAAWCATRARRCPPCWFRAGRVRVPAPGSVDAEKPEGLVPMPPAWLTGLSWFALAVAFASTADVLRVLPRAASAPGQPGVLVLDADRHDRR